MNAKVCKTSKDGFGTVWAMTKIGKVCVYALETTPEAQVREMSDASLARAVEWPQPMEDHMNLWVSMSGKLLDITREVLEVN